MSYQFLITTKGEIYVKHEGHVIAQTTLSDLQSMQRMTGEEEALLMSDKSRSFRVASDRGMSVAEWQKWLVASIIDKHQSGASDYEVTAAFAEEFDRRYGSMQIEALEKENKALYALIERYYRFLGSWPEQEIVTATSISESVTWVLNERWKAERDRLQAQTLTYRMEDTPYGAKHMGDG